MRIGIILFSFSIICLANSCYSQIREYETFKEKYEKYKTENNLDSALIFAKQMNSWAFKNEGDTSLRYAVSTRYIGNCFHSKIPDSTLIYYKKSVSILSDQGRKIHLESANGNFNIGLYYDKKGDFTNAELYYLNALEIKQKIFGRDNLDFTNTLLIIANLHFNNSNYKLASEQYEEVLNTRIKLLGEKSSLVSDVLFNLGQLKYNSLDYEAATDYFLKVLSIREDMLDSLDPQIVFVLYKLGENYRQLKDWSNSEKYLLDALNKSVEIYGTNEVEYVAVIESLGLLYWDISDYKKAEVYLSKNVEVFEKSFGNLSIEYSDALLNLSQLYAEKGDFAAARMSNKQSIEISKKNFGSTSAEVASGICAFAALLYDMGEVDSAVYYNKLAIEILHNLPSEKLLLSIAIGNLGNCYNTLSRWKEANFCFSESLKIKSEIGDTLENYAILLMNQGLLMINLNNILEGQKKLFEAFAIQKRIIGIDHIQTATTIQNIACSLSDQGKYDEALNYLNETKESIARLVGKNHPKYAKILIAIGNMYSNKGDTKNAMESYMESLKVYENSIGSKNDNVADLFHNIGNLFFEEKNYEKSKYYYLCFLEITKENHSKNNDLVSTYMQLATVCSYLNETSMSEKYISEVLECLKNNISTNYAWLSQNERNSFTAGYLEYFDKLNALNSLFRLPSLIYTTILYNNSLISKSLLLETSLELDQAISNSSDELLKSQFSEMKQLRRLVSKMQSEGSDKKEIIERYNHQADSLDKILVNKVGEYANAKRKFEITWKDVQTSLLTTDAAIEFARYYDYKDSTYKYMALVVRPEYEYPKLVKLGSELNIKNSSSQKEFSELYNYVWRGIDSLLTGVKTIYYSSVGELNNVSFSALVSENKNQSDSSTSNWSYLIDRYDLHQVTTTRYLADGTLNRNDSLPLSIKLIGGVNYSDLPLSKDSIEENETTEDFVLQINLQNEVIDPKSNRGGKISYLKGSEIEVKEIAKTLKNSGWVATISDGKNAGEYQFKEELNEKSPGIVHIATHGFAFPEKVTKVENDFQIKETATYKISEDPMVRCGLMLSGANVSWSGDSKKMIETTGDDGILTAAEVANLDLSNTKLVVLSACETGLGKIESSEGTFGLKRGFKLAGVDQVIVSLWKVPDNETMELMTLFYSELAKTNDIDLSFNKAQREMRNRYPYEPEKWAGFVLVQ